MLYSEYLNMQAEYVCRLCLLLHAAGALFSVENPANSFFWKSRWWLVLCERIHITYSRFCQCAYALQLPGCANNEYCKKDTIVAANFNSITQLDRKCPGISAQHKHVHAWGAVRVDGRSLHRAACAGRDSRELCSAWADVIAIEMRARASQHTFD